MQPAPMASTFHILSFGSTCPASGTGCEIIRQRPRRSRTRQTSQPPRPLPNRRRQAIRSEISALGGHSKTGQ